MSEWISVKDIDKSPMIGVNVLAYRPSAPYGSKVAVCKFHGHAGGFWSGNFAVTHWMPLPELPKEVADHE